MVVQVLEPNVVGEPSECVLPLRGDGGAARPGEAIRSIEDVTRPSSRAVFINRAQNGPLGRGRPNPWSMLGRGV